MGATQSIAVGKDLWTVEPNGLHGRPYNIRAGKRILTLCQPSNYKPGDSMAAVDFHDLSQNPTGLFFRETAGGTLEHVAA